MIEVLDPTGKVASGEGRMAPRLLDLHHKAVGFLDNGKFNVDVLMTSLEESLSQTYSLIRRVKVKKPATSKPAPAEMLSQLVLQCDLVINGVGD